MLERVTKSVVLSLGHFRLGKIDFRLVRKSVIKIRLANCEASINDRSGTVRNCAFRSFPVGRRKREVPAFSFLFLFSILSTSVISKNVATKLVGLTLARPAGRLKVAEYSSRAERALAR